MKPDISPNENVSTARFNNWRTLLPQSIDVWLLCVALLIPLAMCVAKLNLDLWHDEAYTLMYFVSGGLRQIATDYNCANNHLFYLMALYPFFEFSNATVILRAPSLFFAVGTLFFVYRTLKRNVSAGAGVLGVLWLGLNQMFLGHVMQLRGYGLSMFLMAILADWAFRSERPEGWHLHRLHALLLACFLYTLPSNVLFVVPLAGAALFICWSRDAKFRDGLSDFSPWLVGPILAALAYLPIVRQVLAFSSAANTEPKTWFHGEFAVSYYKTCLQTMSMDAPWLWGVLAVGVLFWLPRLRSRGWKDVSVLFPVLLLFSLIGPFLLLLVVPAERLLTRNFTALLPLFALMAGWLLWMLLDGLRQMFFVKTPGWTTTLAGMVALYGFFLIPVLTYSNRLAEYRETTFAQDGYYNYYLTNFRAREVIRYLKENLPPNENYIIGLDKCTQVNLYYYMILENFSRRHLTSAGNRVCIYRFYYIAPSTDELTSIASDVALSTATLRQMPIDRDFGYYKLHKSRELLTGTFPERHISPTPVHEKLRTSQISGE